MSTILITGSTDGIGLETARQLAAQRHELILHGRSEARLQHARNTILKSFPHASIHTAQADFSDLSQVEDMAQNLLLQSKKIDVLINNAGVYMTERKLSKNGFEMTIAVNHLAHFLLTTLLLPLLKQSLEPRVVTVSSVAHMNGRIEFDNLNCERKFNSFHAYCNSKLANALFAVELARRESWLASNSLHPGVIDTKLLHAGFDMKGDKPESGARTSVYLATSEKTKGISGKYFDNCKQTPPSPDVLDAALAQRLWQWSEKAIASVIKD